MSEYFIPAGEGVASYVEKRSEFIGHVRAVESEDEAKAYIAELKKRYYDARHNCWCYIIKDGAVRYSDDGEPQGTAGIPMLEVFKRENVENAVCVVTRYFGGVLLGTGGLLRAYTKAAKDALTEAGISVVRRWILAETSIPYSLLERLRLECESKGVVIDALDYAADIKARLLLPEASLESFRLRLCDISAGSATLSVLGESFLPVKIK